MNEEVPQRHISPLPGQPLASQVTSVERGERGLLVGMQLILIISYRDRTGMIPNLSREMTGFAVLISSKRRQSDTLKITANISHGPQFFLDGSHLSMMDPRI